MTRARWHMVQEGACLTLSRRLPARFDVVAEARLPDAPARSVASQVRQDLWRHLRHVRGFQPVVEVTHADGGLHLRAGGAVDAARFPKARLEAEIAALLASAPHRARWVMHARRRASDA